MKDFHACFSFFKSFFSLWIWCVIYTLFYFGFFSSQHILRLVSSKFSLISEQSFTVYKYFLFLLGVKLLYPPVLFVFLWQLVASTSLHIFISLLDNSVNCFFKDCLPLIWLSLSGRKLGFFVVVLKLFSWFFFSFLVIWIIHLLSVYCFFSFAYYSVVAQKF